jgi:hypothetical protein
MNALFADYLPFGHRYLYSFRSAASVCPITGIVNSNSDYLHGSHILYGRINALDGDWVLQHFYRSHRNINSTLALVVTYLNHQNANSLRILDSYP